jgi:uncharacterized RDD family membrane protein YckC
MASVFSRRVVAYIIDFFVISAVMWIVAYLIFGAVDPKEVYKIYDVLPYVSGALTFVYFVLSEKLFGASIGKSVLYLEVKSKNGANISWLQAIVRNLTKICWVPIIFDWLIGKILRSDRLLNNITRTIVINELH